MATTPKNNLKLELSRKSMFDHAAAVLSAAVNINQGDMVTFDDTLNILKPMVAGDEANMLGISPVTIVAGKMASPYSTSNDAAVGFGELPGPRYGSVHDLILKTADAFNPGDKVYPGADAQTVTSVAGLLLQIGVYQGVAVASATAGQTGPVLVGARFPANVLQF